jgi:3-keto-5-aminohexanoate cleavage enzyme
MTPIVIVAAVNGGYQQSQGVTRVPITPLEVAQEAARCREAGAAVLHFHARDEDGVTTSDLDVFRETIRLVREHSDILIQTTNGIGARKDKATGEWVRPTEEDRLALLNLDPRPDLYGAATGSTDFVHPHGGGHVERPFINNVDWMQKCVRNAHARGSAIEFEIVHLPALMRLKGMADAGLFDADADYLWLSYAGGIAHAPHDPQVILASIELGRRLFPNAKVSVMGAGPHQFPLTALGMIAGCDITRVGLEDNRFRGNGEPAESNAQLVADTVQMASYFARRPATPDEARQVFRLDRKAELGAVA